jgi:tetratricopeptide (TPR) repeat protein
VKCLDACHEAAVRALNELYMKEKYAEALQAWEALYESTPSPMLLTNIAGALYKLDRCEEALAAYRLLSPMNANSGQAGAGSGTTSAKTMSRIQELEGRCGGVAAAGLPRTAPTASTSSGTAEAGTAQDAAAGAPAARAPAPRPVVSSAPAAAPSSAPSINVSAEGKPVYKRAWIWATVGGVALAATAIGLGVGLGVPRDPEASEGFRGMTFALNF